MERADVYIPEFPDWIVYSFGWIAVVIALVRGGGDERAVAALVMFQLLNSWADVFDAAKGLPTNLVALAVSLGLVLRGRRYWTIWAAASAALSTLTDLLRIGPGLTDWSFSSAQLVWFYVQIAALLWGGLTWRTAGRAADAVR